jgi:putative transcriptional regulator
MNRFESYFSQQPNLSGTVLVASPRLSNTPMAEAVVLVIQDSQEGVFGVRLNASASSQQVSDFEAFTQLPSLRDALMIGGPLNGPVIALHRNEDLAEVEIRDGIFVSCSKDALQMLVEDEANVTDNDGAIPMKGTASDYRIVMGIAGWQTSQIHREIDAALWYPIQCDADIVFADSEEMWVNAARRYGNDVAYDVTGVNSYGVDCQLN